MGRGKNILIIAACILLGVGVGYFMWQKTRSSEAGGDLASVPAARNGDETATTGAQSVAPALKALDVKVPVSGGAGQPRVLGNEKAPVTLTQYSSFTCPHCAHFHEQVLPVLLRDYVATGKVKVVMADFPLNKEAMDATKLSRCVPTENYIAFTSTVFENISAWTATHPQTLKQYAALAGLDNAKADACMADVGMEDAVINAMKNAAGKFKIQSTPSFVINNDPAQTIIGAIPVAEFTAALDKALEGK